MRLLHPRPGPSARNRTGRECARGLVRCEVPSSKSRAAVSIDATRTPKSAPVPGRRTYVLDTSVLLADPGALRRFAEHEVVLPVVVITELEGKRHHPELGYFARSALRMLDEMRISHGRRYTPVPVGDEGGNARVDLNHRCRVAAVRLPAGRQRHPDPRGRAE